MLPLLSRFNSKRGLKGFWQTWLHRAMPVLLLLSFLGVCACLEEDCVLGIVGEPVSLPCLYPELSTLKNVSIEWLREDRVVLASVWKEDRNVEKWSVDGAVVSDDALLTGNLSLQLPAVDPVEDKVDYMLLVETGGNQSALLCTVCLRSAASFSSPLLDRDNAHGDESAYVCHSSGGFPKPVVYWLINDAEVPPEGSVRTLVASNPDSHLYNVTSHLTLDNANVSSVSCMIQNQFMNETLTSTSYKARGIAVAKEPSEALWIFSLVVCVAVGAMVMAAVVYQVHLDRRSKKKKQEYENSNRGYKRQFPDEAEAEMIKIETEV